MRTSATSTYLREKGTCVYVSDCKIERNIAQIDSTTCLVVHYVQDYEGQKKKKKRGKEDLFRRKQSTVTIDRQHLGKKDYTRTHTRTRTYKQIRIQ